MFGVLAVILAVTEPQYPNKDEGMAAVRVSYLSVDTRTSVSTA